MNSLQQQKIEKNSFFQSLNSVLQILSRPNLYHKMFFEIPFSIKVVNQQCVGSFFKRMMFYLNEFWVRN